MKRYTHVFWGFVLVMIGLFIGCHENDRGITQTGSGAGNLSMNVQISDCGGFDAEQRNEKARLTNDPLCGDERLIWSYDPASQTIQFLNTNVWLNCCGDRTITVTLNEETNTYIISETDAPASGSARCRCMCFFDFKVDVPHIVSETITVALSRHITDEGRQWIVWTGTLDLREQEGKILIQENVGWCNP
jgi:hypothetical protein